MASESSFARSSTTFADHDRQEDVSGSRGRCEVRLARASWQARWTQPRSAGCRVSLEPMPQVDPETEVFDGVSVVDAARIAGAIVQGRIRRELQDALVTRPNRSSGRQNPSARPCLPFLGVRVEGFALYRRQSRWRAAALMSAERLVRGLKYGASSRVFAPHHSSGRSSMLSPGRSTTRAENKPLASMRSLPSVYHQRRTDGGRDRRRVPGVADAGRRHRLREIPGRGLRAAACRPSSAPPRPPPGGDRQSPMCQTTRAPRRSRFPVLDQDRRARSTRPARRPRRRPVTGPPNDTLDGRSL